MVGDNKSLLQALKNVCDAMEIEWNELPDRYFLKELIDYPEWIAINFYVVLVFRPSSLVSERNHNI